MEPVDLVLPRLSGKLPESSSKRQRIQARLMMTARLQRVGIHVFKSLPALFGRSPVRWLENLLKPYPVYYAALCRLPLVIASLPGACIAAYPPVKSITWGHPGSFAGPYGSGGSAALLDE